MITSRRVALNGEELDQVDSRIVIQGFETKAGKDTFGTVTAYGRPGQRVTADHRDSMDIMVRFSIRAKKEYMDERSQVFEKVNAWARIAKDAAWLTTNEKQGRRIRVRIVQHPDEGDEWNWTGIYTITFRAYDIPYWQDVNPNSLRRANTKDASLKLNIGGNAETLLNIGFVNTSGGTVNSIAIGTGSSRMIFAGLELKSGQTFRIAHAENGRLTVTANGSSAMANIGTESDDDLWIGPGIATVTFTADGAGTLEIESTGRYA